TTQVGERAACDDDCIWLGRRSPGVLAQWPAADTVRARFRGSRRGGALVGDLPAALWPLCAWLQRVGHERSPDTTRPRPGVRHRHPRGFRFDVDTAIRCE